MGNSCPCCSSSDPAACSNTFCQKYPSCCKAPYECNSGDSSVRRVSMIFTSASNPILYKGVSVNQAVYAVVEQSVLGGRRIAAARSAAAAAGGSQNFFLGLK